MPWGFVADLTFPVIKLSVHLLLQAFDPPDCTEYENAILKAREDSG